MNCSLPQSITDRDLLAYLDGEDRPDVLAHLASCPACRQRAQALRASDTRLRDTLYRLECPTAQTLGDYHHSFLTATERAAVAAHLNRCPHCAAELARLVQFLADIEPTLALSPFATARVLVARLVTWGRDAVGTMGVAPPGLLYSAVRGAAEATRVYQAEAFQVILDCEPDPTRPGRHRIQGLLTRDDGDMAEVFEARLDTAGQSTVTALVDDLGDFAYSGLMPGVYRLTLVGPGLEIQVGGIDLR